MICWPHGIAFWYLITHISTLFLALAKPVTCKRGSKNNPGTLVSGGCDEGGAADPVTKPHQRWTHLTPLLIETSICRQVLKPQPWQQLSPDCHNQAPCYSLPIIHSRARDLPSDTVGALAVTYCWLQWMDSQLKDCQHRLYCDGKW